ncbi:hypothetical protein LTR27_005644 [Elasticomyces elasticus]|nr:hypothetical protein LTR27_005644 [Elasticomyces elasticus]
MTSQRERQPQPEFLVFVSDEPNDHESESSICENNQTASEYEPESEEHDSAENISDGDDSASEDKDCAISEPWSGAYVSDSENQSPSLSDDFEAEENIKGNKHAAASQVPNFEEQQQYVRESASKGYPTMSFISKPKPRPGTFKLTIPAMREALSLEKRRSLLLGMAHGSRDCSVRASDHLRKISVKETFHQSPT